MKHIISTLVENRFGVLAHIAGLFTSRGFNIDSLTVGETHDPTISRMTIVVSGDDRIIEQVNKQLNKLIDVIKVQDLTLDERVERELLLIKVNCNPNNRSEIVELVEIFKGKIADFSPRAITMEIVGDEEKIEAFIALMRTYGIKEMARTGRIALPREKKRPVEQPPS